MSLYGYVRKSKPAVWTRNAAYRRQQQSERKQFKRIVPVSKRRQLVTAEYRREARAFVKAAIKEGQCCPVFAAFETLPQEMQDFLCFRYKGQIRRRSSKLNEVHHVFGRSGELLLWKLGWKAISKWGHRCVHAFPEEAKKRGWMAPDGIWNDFQRAQEYVSKGADL